MAKSCFTPIQSKRFHSKLKDVTLCPSMDLICHDVTIHRILNWQKVAAHFGEDAHCCCWRPDGRAIAVAQRAESPCIRIFEIEDLLTENATPSTVIRLENPVKLMRWVHAGPLHPQWQRKDQQEIQLFRNIKRKYSYAQHERNTNLLCVIDVESRLSIFVQGSFPIVKNLPVSPAMDIQVSPDLTNIIICSPTKIVSYSIPELATKRQELGRHASLFAATNALLEQMQTNLFETKASYKSCMKPLDVKLEALAKLVENYSLDKEQLAQFFLEFALSGHNNSDLSNAMDQFFTGMHLNDQLLVRMNTTLTAAIANVEVRIRQHIVIPAREIFTLLQQLYDKEIFQMSQQLVIVAEHILGQAIEVRRVLADWVGWLRSTSAETKARGTAPNSVQRENASKRRVSDQVTRRVLRRLQLGKGITTEDLLCLELSRMLSNEENTNPADLFRAIHNHDSQSKKLPPLSNALRELQANVIRFFEKPSLQICDTTLQLVGEHVACCTRLGSDGGNATDGCFTCLPGNFRQWTLVAQASNHHVSLLAIPLAWTDTILMENDALGLPGTLDASRKQGIFREHSASLILLLPEEFVVRDIGFYGDDGKSGLEGGTGKESRQALVLLLEKRSDGELQLWLVDYDELNFAPTSLEQLSEKSLLFNPSSTSADCHWRVVELQENSNVDEQELEPNQVVARTRVLRNGEVNRLSSPSSSSFKLVLSGSRGVGAIVVSEPGVTMLELLDLEEDEVGEEGSEEDMEN